MSGQFSPELIDLANAIRETEAEYKRLSALKDTCPNAFIAAEIALKRASALKVEFNRILDADMTLDDLVKVYVDASHADGNWCDSHRTGIAAVVRALAPDDDEIAAYIRLSYRVQEQLKCECEHLPEDRCVRCSVVDALKCLETRYYEILGEQS